MTEPTLTIELSRESLNLPPLILSGGRDQPIGITNYQEPAMQARIQYAEARHLHGSVALSAVWQQSMLGFDIVADQEDTETEMRALVRQVRAAIGQFAYTATVTINDASPEVWDCDMGSMVAPNGRTYADLVNLDPIYQVTIPVYPIASA